MPTIIREEYSLPETLKPIFRDVTNIPVGELRDLLREELERSKFLIVVCSPDSAQSKWVNREVEYFIELGRFDKIIPFIIAGNPGGGAQECYVPILQNPPQYRDIPEIDLSIPKNKVTNERHKAFLRDLLKDRGQLNGVSQEREGQELCHFKILAKMLGIDPGVILSQNEVIEDIKRKREAKKAEEEKRKQRFWKRITFMGIAAVLIAFFAVLGTYLSQHREAPVITRYYADYVERWGVPEGLFELTAEQIKQRENHYRIETKAGKVLRLVHANSAGTPIPVENTELKDRPMIAEYDYSLNTGKIAKCVSKNRNRGTLLTYVYTDDNLNSVNINKKEQDTLEENKDVNSQKSADERKENDNENGSDEDNPKLAPLDKFKDDFSPSFQIQNDPLFEKQKNQVGQFKLERNKDGFITKCLFQKAGYNVPALDENGIAGFKYELDEMGRIKEKIMLNVNGAPCSGKNGEAKQVFEYDNTGNLLSVTFCDLDGKPHATQEGYASVRREYNPQNNNIIAESYLGIDGKPCLNSNCYAGVKWTYDENTNRLLEIGFLGLDGNPCMIRDGYSIVKLTYNRRGNVIRKSYYNVSGLPTLNLNGFASINWAYDERGKQTEESYFGVDDKSCLNKEGVASVRWNYDERGNVVETAYFGVDDNSCLNKEGVASVRWNYDERGNAEEQSYFDVDGKRCLCALGFAIVRSKFNARGNKTEIAFYDTEKKLCLTKNGYAIRKMRYDVRGNNLFNVAYYGTDEAQCLCKDGYSSVRWTYDEWGDKIIETAYFDANNKSCLSNKQIAGWKSEFDSQNREIKRSFFGLNGESVPLGGYDPYVAWEKTYSEDGKLLTQTWVYTIKPWNGVLGKCKATYDEQGNRIEVAYFDEVDFLCLNNEQIAGWKSEFDSQNRETKRAFFGKDGQPCLCKDGYASVKLTYDERGNRTEIAYFDMDGKPCLNKDGYAKKIVEYDEQGIEIRARLFDENGKEVESPGESPSAEAKE